MDFEQTPEGAEAAELARAILDKHCTAERVKEVEAGPARFDHDLWRRFADSGLIALTVPEEHNDAIVVDAALRVAARGLTRVP